MVSPEDSSQAHPLQSHTGFLHGLEVFHMFPKQAVICWQTAKQQNFVANVCWLKEEHSHREKINLLRNAHAVELVCRARLCWRGTNLHPE